MILLTSEKKTVLVRVDLNSTYDRKILDNERFAGAETTIKELIRKNAKVVLLAHQGRAGEKDFLPLNQHAKILSRYIGKKVIFVPDVIGAKAKKAIKNLRPGDVLLLNNVRFVKDEEDEKKALASKSSIVKALAPLADIFVNDAFSVSHRAQASVVGFARLPCCFGRLMQEEIESVKKVFGLPGPHVFILGGAKSDDCIGILEHILKTNPQSIAHALTCGVTANIFMKAKGMKIGKKSEELIKKKKLEDQIGYARNILKKYSSKIILPEDVAIESKKKRIEVPIKKIPADAQILDIGNVTIKKYKKIITAAKTIVVKGPAGLYEDKRFSKGTKELFDCVAKSRAFSIIGGGDTTQALNKLKISRKKFSHVSLGGGALITYLSGKSMPGIDVILKKR
ncbi:MAG: phosphoglycerate kinase [Candidatus Aenigmarchaeota archaeon]|nr:phosphoglycerate kinase [Candidatus Aenigmarchaeota archaeon]